MDRNSKDRGNFHQRMLIHCVTVIFVLDQAVTKNNELAFAEMMKGPNHPL